MAQVVIDFVANTSGQHSVFYRTYKDAPGVYNSIDINVVNPGPQSVTIDIDDNLYCAYDGVVVDGFVYPECMDFQPTTNGVPDSVLAAGTTFTVTIPQQPDPCEYVTIECNNGGLDVDPSTPQESISIVDSGAGYDDGNYALVFSAPDLPGGITPIGAVAMVLGGIDNIIIANGGSGYTSPPTVSINYTGASTPTTVAILVANMAACPFINIADARCAGLNEVDTETGDVVAFGDTLKFCADRTNLDALLVANTRYAEVPNTHPNAAYNVNGCHCLECKNILLNKYQLTGLGKVTYQTCWSNPTDPIVMVTRAILPGTGLMDLGCIMRDTLNIDQGTLNALPSIVELPC